MLRGILLLLAVVLVLLVSSVALMAPGVQGLVVLPGGLGLVAWLAFRTRTARVQR